MMTVLAWSLSDCHGEQNKLPYYLRIIFWSLLLFIVIVFRKQLAGFLLYNLLLCLQFLFYHLSY